MTLLLEFIRPHGWLPLFALLIVNCIVSYRFGGRGLSGMLVVCGVAYGMLDAAWIEAEMSRPGWDGTPDRDAIFLLGMFLRIFFLSTLLFLSFAVTLYTSSLFYVPSLPDSEQHDG
ncbi:hypothetical protein LF1_52390 [Rubripirellula obstinata]|uniref:Transmembrane protein n=1 Tax=Rubripirellula obstinata TaxID=406547 RepID=A0A5B1CCR3_9BACT|nr:hypothetical protein [Rubripirellula obstinata]KAA1257390.1 hypothetical protein LF1_52390 [Rubripirellula obstinata]